MDAWIHFIEQKVFGVYHVGQRIPELGLRIGAAGGECGKCQNSAYMFVTFHTCKTKRQTTVAPMQPGFEKWKMILLN